MLAAIDRVLAPLTWLAAAFTVVALAIGPELIGADAEVPAGAPPSGEEVFASAGCGGCHTLAAAGASGVNGPDLDALEPDTATVTDAVTYGRGGMPAFGGDLSPAEIAAVADYVSASAGG
jgi:mono/diheme cytochrome c family protein